MNRYFATVANKILFSNFIRFIFCILTVSLSLSSYIYIYFNTIFNNCIVRAFWFLKVFLNENFLGRLAEFVSLSFLFLFRRKWTITSERIDRKIAKSFAFPRSTSIVYTIRELESISSRYIFISFFSRSLYDKTPSLRYSAVTSNIGYKFPVYRISRFVIV